MKVPRSLAIIMDGNGRWAESRGLPRVRGHEEGARSVREITRACRELGVESLILYSFSTENWKRPADEVSALMGLLREYLGTERDELLDNHIRLNAIGQLDRLPIYVRTPLAALCRDTARPGVKMTLTLALSYGGRAELVEAARRIAQDAKKGKLDPEKLDETTFSRYLMTADLPDPDLLIRTSGELRISNFLPWQLAYSEFYVTDLAWPDFRKPQLIEAFERFGSRERRFGLTGAQVKA